MDNTDDTYRDDAYRQERFKKTYKRGDFVFTIPFLMFLLYLLFVW